jgi:T5SS/PEP-CTERM-associated repeat protein
VGLLASVLWAGPARAAIVSYYFKLGPEPQQRWPGEVVGFVSYDLSAVGNLVYSESSSIQVNYPLKSFSFVWNGEQYLSTDVETPFSPYVMVVDGFVDPAEPLNVGSDLLEIRGIARSAAGTSLEASLSLLDPVVNPYDIINSPDLPADLTTWPVPTVMSAIWESYQAAFWDSNVEFGFLESKTGALGANDFVWVGGSGEFHQPTAWSGGVVPSVSNRALFSLAPMPGLTEVITFAGDATVNEIGFLGDRNLEFQLGTHRFISSQDVVLGREPGSVVELTMKNGIASAPRFVVGGGGTGVLNFVEGMTVLGKLVVGDLGGSAGTVTFSGADSKWEMKYLDTPLIVGKAGNGSLTIADGALMSVDLDIDADAVIGQEAGSTGRVTVQGAGSRLLVQGEIIVGLKGNGSLEIRNGGFVGGPGLGASPVPVRIGGPFPGSSAALGEVLVDGAGSKLLTDQLTVGELGTGKLTVQDGGLVEVADFGSVAIGNAVGGQGEVLVQDPGSALTVGSNNFGFDVGKWGHGKLNIENGGLVWNKGDAVVGRFLDASQSTVVVDGADSLWRSGEMTPLGFAGNILLDTGAVMTVQNGGQVETGVLQVQNGSRVLLDNGDLFVSLFDLLPGATLAGNGTIAGDVVNNGVIVPGQSPGKLAISGDYTQSADGRLEIELAGYGPGTQFDLLEIGGTATLGGTLQVSLLGGFLPGLADTFDFLTAGSIEGTFDQVLFGGGTVDVTYLASGLRLSNFNLAAVPEPGTWAMLLTGAAAAVALRRRQRTPRLPTRDR